MSWIKFLERLPEEGKRLITRGPGLDGTGNSLEDWTIWNNSYLEARFPNGKRCFTHWWDGEFNFKLAIKNWYENETKIKKSKSKNQRKASSNPANAI